MTQAVVTPEAVVLEFETAGVGSRLVAGVIDLAAMTVLFSVAFIGMAFIGSAAPVFGQAGVFLALFLIVFGYPIASETLWRGRTLGKAAMGQRVITVEGAPIGFRHAAIRGFLRIVDIQLTFGGLGVICIWASPRNQRLGDMVAGTLVVRERTGAAAPEAMNFFVPYGYEQYAATLDVSGLSAWDYGAARSFLLRAESLDPYRRFDIARQIATPLLGRLRHTPPDWVGPEALLACVAGVYQSRQREAAQWAPAPQTGWPSPTLATLPSSPIPTPVPHGGYAPPT